MFVDGQISDQGSAATQAVGWIKKRKDRKGLQATAATTHPEEAEETTRCR